MTNASNQSPQFVYIVTHTENDYYGDSEKFMGCGATHEAAKDALLEYLGQSNKTIYTWENLEIEETMATPLFTRYCSGKSDWSTKFLHEYTITKIEVRQ